MWIWAKLSHYLLDQFHELFTKWNKFAWIFLTRSSFSDSWRDIAMATSFFRKQNAIPRPFFCNFIPYESVLGADDRSDFFSISQGTLPWQPILCHTVSLLARSRSISGSAGLIFTTFEPYGRYWIADYQSILLSDILRDVTMVTNFVAKFLQNYLPPALIALSFRNGMGYRLAYMHIYRSINCSISSRKWWKSVQ